MGRWTRKALEAVAPLLGVDVMGVEYEPLAEANVGWYQTCFEKTYLPQSRLGRSLWYRSGFADRFRMFVQDSRNTIHGHTILIAYHKRPF